MRGVNKLVLEISSNEDDYFEKAILFVRAEKAGCSQRELSESAQRLLEAVRTTRKRKRIAPAIAVAGAILLMAAATGAILIFC